MVLFGRRILSMDMGNHSYKFIEAQKTPRLRILRYGVCPSIQFSNNISPARELKRLGYRTRDTVLSFHHQSLIIRGMKLPAQNTATMHRSIQETILQYETDFKEELDYDYYLDAQGEQSDYYQAIAVAVPKSINREYIDMSVRLGLRPVSVDVQINAAHRAIKRLVHSTCLLIDFGYDTTTVGIGSMEGMAVIKAIPIGCRMLKENSSNWEVALNRVLSVCQQLIDYYMDNHSREQLTQGVLYGGGAQLPDVRHFIMEQIPLNWYDLNHYKAMLPFLPENMDLNLFLNCIGSLLWEEGEQEEERV